MGPEKHGVPPESHQLFLLHFLSQDSFPWGTDPSFLPLQWCLSSLGRPVKTLPMFGPQGWSLSAGELKQQRTGF